MRSAPLSAATTPSSKLEYPDDLPALEREAPLLHRLLCPDAAAHHQQPAESPDDCSPRQPIIRRHTHRPSVARGRSAVGSSPTPARQALRGSGYWAERMVLSMTATASASLVLP